MDNQRIVSREYVQGVADRLDDLEDENFGVDYAVKDTLQCGSVQPEGSRLIGEGRNRCVFEKSDKIVKVAKWRQGRQENQGAKDVMLHASEPSKDSFAMPEAVDESNSVVVQEKIERGEPANVYGESELRNLVDIRMGEVAERDDIICRDIGHDDVGRKNGDPALLDLGGCDKR